MYKIISEILVSVSVYWPYHHILYLCCPDAMTAHVDDII